MTTEERKAITKILSPYMPTSPKYYIAKNQYCDSVIYMGIKALIENHISTSHSISDNIKAFTGVYISPKRLERYSQNIFIEIEHKKCL